jgi:hypothetical protein
VLARVLRRVLTIALLFCFGAAGCTSVPPARVVEGISPEGLASHVEFLCGPKLAGRGPGTQGSRIARQYIKSRFTAYGLVPWAGLRSYDVGFGLGTNVVGVLPGSDANLAGEIVLVSAHYDHLGKEQGKVYPGAADNASGVAVLLETAKQMSLFEKRPKRSVAFVAFDCEEQMLVGSMAFTCRADVWDARIVAVVNVDTIGRDFLGVVRNTLLVAGTERYPALQNHVRRLGTEAGIRVLPIGTDWIGPRSDHAPFEMRGAPCLFFCSGTYPDYHKPTDTPDKLNYGDIACSSQVILATVRELADEPEPQRTPHADAGDLEELRTVVTLLSEVVDGAAEAGVNEKDVEALKGLKNQAQTLLNTGRYDGPTREDLLVDAGEVLVPYLVPTVEAKSPANQRQQMLFTLWVRHLQYLYVKYRGEITEGYRNVIAQVLERPPGLFRGMPKREYALYDIPDDLVSLRQTGPGRYRLDALVNMLTITIGPARSILFFPAPSISPGLEALKCEGSREQIADYCLVLMRDRKDRPVYAEALKRLFAKVTATEPGGICQDLLKDRLERGGFDDESQWLLHCIQDRCPDLSRVALNSAGPRDDPRICAAACRIAADPNVRADVRVAAVRVAVQTRTKDGLLVACDLLNDATVTTDTDFRRITDPNYTFADRAVVKIARAYIRNMLLIEVVRPLGNVARQELKQATGQDFGADAEQWRKWIRSH